MNNHIDPQIVPKRTLYTGEQIPCIGMGTFGSNRFSNEQICAAVAGAIKAGYRFFDCAARYGNEEFIGRVFSSAFANGIVKREELFIASKVWTDMLGPGGVLLSLAKTLKDLNLDYIDLFFIHWPFPRIIPKGCDIDYRDPNAKPFSVEEFMGAWRQMERLVEIGLARNIGMSNMTVPKLKAVLPLCRIKPAAVQMELHPYFQQPELFNYCVENGIQPIGFAPIGSPTRPDRDRTDADLADIEDPVLIKIANKYAVHPAIICLRWAITRGQIPIPFSVYENEYVSNLRCTLENPLSDEEMKLIEGLDRNNRLFKAHVMLWPGAKRWEDLWDINGEITK